MDTDLMGTAGFQPTFHHGSSTKTIGHAIMGYGMFAAPFPMNGHLLSIGVGPPDPGIDGADRRNRNAIHNGGIKPIDAMILELPRQTFMRTIRFGNDQKSRCILVDPVNDAGALDSADA